MLDDNLTIFGIKKDINEGKQGEVLFYEHPENQSKKFYIESYGCAMNFSDSEIVASILGDIGYAPTKDMESADVILVNTCSIREKAEENIRQRLTVFNIQKRKRPDLLIGVLGCMAERLKAKLLEQEKLVDIVVGPDAYRDLPNLLAKAEDGDKSINVLLSREETYADISPLRLDSNGILAYISIMRGCDNMCSFCVVPMTRGRERSRDTYSILAEAQDLFDRGFREVTLLGQNVDSYKWSSPDQSEHVNFAELLERVGLINPDLRVRFSTSHPKDITDDVLFVIKKYENICNYIHLPIQSGNSRILKLMNRTYDREWYMDRVKAIRRIIPDCAISSDIISGFCSETEEDHQDTLSIIEWANFSMSYMYSYSERPGTPAAKKLKDDVPEEEKKRRLIEIVAKQRYIGMLHNLADVGKSFKVLIEGDSKKSKLEFRGRNSQNKMINFPKSDGFKPGNYAIVQVTSSTGGTLKGHIIKD
ncbi:MAG: tRNA (N6-isopentenyl adenosine(37)-C2)-methylthiotransferase MiaB [Saprospiraceae bacterium]|nr:tRNA (N6-isopentenyl adenosine(37)-C2)-methylthiotransferase MiaB [Saprospiraceae bacterium]